MSGAISVNNPQSVNVDDARELDGGSIGFQKLVAHSKLRLAVEREDAKLAKNAVQQINELKTNSQLREDEWERLDDTLQRISQDQLVMAEELRDRGLDVPLDLGVLEYGYEDVSDFDEADVDMAATAAGDEDSLDFGQENTPLPIVHKSFYINRRRLRASRRTGQPLDTAGIAAATRSVSEKIEDIIANGASISIDGNSVDGLTTYTPRETITGNGDWGGSTTDDIIDDFMRTVEAIEDANFAPGNSGFLAFLAKNQLQEARAKSASTDDKRGVLQLIRDRLAEEEDTPDVTIRRADRLGDGNMVLMKPTQDVFQLPMPADIQTVQWETAGGMRQHYKVMGSIMPAPRSDQNNNTGIAHLSGI